jgi:hypothetical protein
MATQRRERKKVRKAAFRDEKLAMRSVANFLRRATKAMKEI